MKTKKYVLGISLIIGSFSCLTAQTTHYINWDFSVGSNATITIDEGDMIEWIHTDPGMPHDVTSSDPNAPIGFGSAIMEFGNTYSFTFNSPVVFDYQCSLHPGSMFGTITVLGAGASCDPPTNLTLDNTTTTTAEFSWTASPTETEGYSWVVMAIGDNPETDPPVANGITATGITTAEATGLMSGTMYHFFVSTLCDNDEESAFAGPLMFMTDSDPVLCNPPTNLTLGNTTTTTAEFSWTASPTETEGYSWVVMDIGDNPETDPPVASGITATGITTAEATGLIPETMYHFFVSTLCDNDEESLFAGPLMFMTDAEPVLCDAPTDVSVDDITDSYAQFSWTASPTETEGYNWVVMNSGDDPETDTPVTSGVTNTGVTTAEATGLMPETMYHFYIATMCDDSEQSNFEGPVIFTTQAIIGLKENSFDDFEFFPNPTSGIVHFKSKSKIQQITVFNILHQLVFEVQNTNDNGIVDIDLSELENGAYFAIVKTHDKTKSVKLIKK